METAAVANRAQRPDVGRRGPILPVGWQAAFLEAYETTGTLWWSAKMAGVSADTVERYRASDPAFGAQIEEARQTYADGLEQTMDSQFRKGNVVAGIVLLKKHRPAQFVERHMALNVNIDVQVPAEQARQVLGEMLAHLTPSSVHALAGEPTHEQQTGGEGISALAGAEKKALEVASGASASALAELVADPQIPELAPLPVVVGGGK